MRVNHDIQVDSIELFDDGDSGIYDFILAPKTSSLIEDGKYLIDLIRYLYL